MISSIIINSKMFTLTLLISTIYLFIVIAVGVLAALPRTVRGQPMIISGKEDKKTILYAHGSNIYIRNIEVIKNTTTSYYY